MKSQKQFVLNWFKALGWKNNPFEDRVPRPIVNFIAGLENEKKKINFFIIKRHPFGIIRGSDGEGKTTLLNWLQSQLIIYTTRLKVVRINAKDVISKNINKLIFSSLLGAKEKAIAPYYKLRLHKLVNKLKKKVKPIAESSSFYEKIFTQIELSEDKDRIRGFLEKKIGKKILIILIDDIEQLYDVNIKSVNELLDLELSIVIVATSDKEKLKEKRLANLVDKDNLKLNLRKLSFNEIKEMVMKRIKSVGGTYIDPFTDGELLKTAKKADYNPRQVLRLCIDTAAEIAIKQLRSKKDLKKADFDVKDFREALSELDKKEKKTESYKVEEVHDTQTDKEYEVKMVKPKDRGYVIKEEEK